MQASIKLFDVSPKASSPKVSSIDPCKMPAGTAKQGEGTTPDQLSEFLEIMSALMFIPPDQWKSSLEKMRSVSPESGSATFDSLTDVDWKDVQSSKLMDVLSELSGPIQEALENADAQDKPYQLLNTAKTILDEQDKIVSNCGESCVDDSKTKWLKIEDAACDMAVQDEVLTDADEVASLPSNGRNSKIELSAAKNLISGKDLSADSGRSVNGLAPNLLSDTEPPAEPESEDVPAPGTTAFEKVDKKALRQVPEKEGAFSRPLEYQRVEDNAQKVADERQLVKDGILKPVSPEKPAAMELQSTGDVDTAEDHSVQTSPMPSSIHQGSVSRPDVRQDQGMVPDSAAKEVIPHDKEMQADIIRQIVQRMSMNTHGTQSRMNIRLQPEFLGNVHMQVVTENHQVTVRMMTESLAVKEMIQQNLQHLRSEFQHHGLEIQKFDVFVGNDGQGWKSGQDHAAFRENMYRRQQRSEGGKTKRQDDMAISAAGHRRINTQKNLNEIDYFA